MTDITNAGMVSTSTLNVTCQSVTENNGIEYANVFWDSCTASTSDIFVLIGQTVLFFTRVMNSGRYPIVPGVPVPVFGAMSLYDYLHDHSRLNRTASLIYMTVNPPPGTTSPSPSPSPAVTPVSSPTPLAPGVCGNAQLEAGEMCDGGAFCSGCQCAQNSIGDGLSPPGCKVNLCGNRARDSGEDCDGGYSCDSTCKCPSGLLPDGAL